MRNVTKKSIVKKYNTIKALIENALIYGDLKSQEDVREAIKNEVTVISDNCLSSVEKLILEGSLRDDFNAKVCDELYLSAIF